MVCSNVQKTTWWNKAINQAIALFLNPISKLHHWKNTSAWWIESQLSKVHLTSVPYISLGGFQLLILFGSLPRTYLANNLGFPIICNNLSSSLSFFLCNIILWDDDQHTQVKNRESLINCYIRYFKSILQAFLKTTRVYLAGSCADDWMPCK